MIEHEFQEYIKSLKNKVETQIQLATKARSLRLDPHANIESKITYNSNTKILAILNIPGLEDHLPSNLSQNDNLVLLAANIAKQIVNGRFIKKNREELVLLALQSALVIISQGLISVPQESIPKVEINANTNHLTIYFSNTIRYATGDTIGLVVLIADYIRHVLHLNRFSPSSNLIARYIEELGIYLTINDRSRNIWGNLLKFLIENIGVEISGEAYERIEVKKYRNLPNLTNQLRMGMCVVFERMIENLNLIARRKIVAGIPEWNWLTPSVKGLSHEKYDFKLRKARGTQPILSESKKPGGFRLRLGRSRNTGQGAAGIHPATMVLSEMLSPGTNIKIDLISRTLTVFPVSTILGPLVELEDGSSVRITTFSELMQIEDQIVQIWEMGDVLLSPDDIPATETIGLSAWVEEWWTQQQEYAIETKFGGLDNLSVILSKLITNEYDENKIIKTIKDPTQYYPSPLLALTLAKLTKVPLHPYYSFNWNEIAISDFIRLVQKINSVKNGLLPYDEDLNLILRQLGVPFSINNGFIRTEKFQLMIQALSGKIEQATQILAESKTAPNIEELIELLTNIPVRSLCSRRLGLRILRVEKAGVRRINPPTHILFPIGSYGGAQRDLLKAKEQSNIEIQLSERYCDYCEISAFTAYCPSCKQKTKQLYFCSNDHISETRLCPECNQYGFPARKKTIDIAGLLDYAIEKVDSTNLKRIKGVSYLTSKNRIPEHIIKGVLRAKHGLFVYKDGTTRFDQTNAVLTHFTPKEIHSSIIALKRLGYSHDIFGNDLTNEDQIIEIYPYDIIVSKEIGISLIDSSKFIDDELTHLYEISPYFRINSLNNLPGSLILGLAPFSMVGIVGRIIGYTENKVVYAHPLWHQLKTRNCNGDIDSITLLLDVFLNFSMEYIPSSRGGSLDVPLIINLSEDWKDTLLYAKYKSIPLNLMLYQHLHENPTVDELLTYNLTHLEPIFQRIHTIDNISQYKFDNKFSESKIIAKIETELRVLRRLRGVEEGEFVDSILENDFLEKISTSISRFFLQPVRCRTCNTTFRRVPLSKYCPVCHRQTIGLTLSEGWVLRYLQIIEQLKDKYISNVSDYCQSWIELIELNKRLLFDRGPRPTRLI
jgi:DNA polymerase II large subunit